MLREREQTTNQDEEVDEIVYKQLGEVLQPLISWVTSVFQISAGTESKQSRKLLECVEVNLLTQVVRKRTREGAPVDLLFANREVLVGNVMAVGCLVLGTVITKW